VLGSEERREGQLLGRGGAHGRRKELERSDCVELERTRRRVERRGLTKGEALFGDDQVSVVVKFYYGRVLSHTGP
jgi:hypothetical protein